MSEIKIYYYYYYYVYLKMILWPSMFQINFDGTRFLELQIAKNWVQLEPGGGCTVGCSCRYIFQFRLVNLSIA